MKQEESYFLNDTNTIVVSDNAGGNFTVVSNSVIKDERLSWEARGVLIYLLSKPQGWRVRKQDLINRSPAGETVIRRVLAELRDFGYLRFRLQAMKETEFTGRKRWLTTVHDTPLPGDPDPERRKWRYFSESSLCGKPTCGDSTRGEPTCGDSTRLVNKEGTKTDVANTEGDSRSRLFEVEEFTETKDKKKATVDKTGYSDTFLQAWAMYPRKQGKVDAWKSWKARINEGITEEVMLTATKNYATYCKRERKEKKFIKHAKTFYGPGEHILEWQEMPRDPQDRKHNVVEHKEDDPSGGGRVSVKDLL